MGSERIAKSLPSNRSPLGSEGQEVLRFMCRQEWLSLENLKVRCFTEGFRGQRVLALCICVAACTTLPLPALAKRSPPATADDSKSKELLRLK